MFIDIERIDSPTQGIQLMDQAARDELVEAANHLAYNYLKHSGAWRSLTNNQWDELAGQIAQRVLGLMDQMVDEAVAGSSEIK